MLDDGLIDAFQALLRESYPTVQGWQCPTLAVHAEDGYERRTCLSVQIHHNGHDHWLVSARTAAGVFLADSLLVEPSGTLPKQLVDLYQTEDDTKYLDVTFVPCQRQQGSVQCGDFAVVNAGLFAALMTADRATMLTAFETFNQDQDQLRAHLVECCKSGTYSTPLALQLAPLCTLPRAATFRIDCENLTVKIV